MKKYIWFLLGVLLSFVLVVPSYAETDCTIYTETGPFVSNQWGQWFASNPNDPSLAIYPDECVGYSTWFLMSYPDNDPGYQWASVYGRCQGYSSPDTDCDGTIDANDLCEGAVDLGSGFDQDGCPLPPPEPSNCSDGVQTAGTDETGIDCGGSCLSACSEYCPVGWTNYSGNCYSPATNMINGLCPEGTNLQNNTDQTCETYTPVVYAGDTFDNTTLDDTSPDWVFNDENSPWVSNVSESTVDNGDGTSTTTTTTTTTINNYDGSTTNNTSTTSTITNNTTGALVSSTSSGTSTEQVPSNIGTSTIEGEYDGTLVEGQDYGSEDSFSDMLDSFDGVGGVGTALGDTQMVISDPVCNVEFADYEISFCGEPYTSWLATFSTLLIAFAYLSAIYIVFRR